MSKTLITALAGYAPRFYETATKLDHILKYFHSITKKNSALLKYEEKRYIFRWKPSLNVNKT